MFKCLFEIVDVFEIVLDKLEVAAVARAGSRRASAADSVAEPLIVVVGRQDVVVVEEETSYVDVAVVVKIDVDEMVNDVVVAFVVVVEAMTFVEKVLASDAVVVVKQNQMPLEMIQKMVYLDIADILAAIVVVDDY